MGDRYIISVICEKCAAIEDDVYYAPTCGFLTAQCAECGYVTDLEEYTGITYEDASNKELIEEIINEVTEDCGR